VFSKANHGGSLKRVENRIVRLISRLDDNLAKGEATALVAMVGVMTGVVFLQVLYRYVFTQPLQWSEELARYLFVWLSILGAALALQKKGHFGLDLFYKMLSSRSRRMVQIAAYLLMGMVIFVILFQGIILVEKTALQESPAMGISMSWAYASLPVGGALMAIHLIAISLKEL
jgi:TRAP-type C4-dicarboxylate transport system permease small subunit